MQFAASPGEIRAETRDDSRSREFSASHVPDAGAARHRAACATAAASRGDPAERRAADRLSEIVYILILAELYRTLIFYLHEHRVSVALILETAIDRWQSRLDNDESHQRALMVTFPRHSRRWVRIRTTQDGMEFAFQARGNFMRGTLAAVIALCFIAVGAASLPASEESTRLQRTDESAFASFDQAIANYVHLKQRLRGEIPAWRVTDNSADIIARADAWARAIQRARPGAQQGDFFDTVTADAIKERLARTLKGTNVAAFLSSINDEPALEASPRVHLRFPDASPVATMPARVLGVLPALPAELEYRFVGRALVLRDRDAALILDYLPNALPPS